MLSPFPRVDMPEDVFPDLASDAGGTDGPIAPQTETISAMNASATSR